MLRRQPSGAQKKIRQRVESQRSVLPVLTVNKRNRAQQQNETAYRQVLDSGAYRSILPPADPRPLQQPRFSCSVSPPGLVSSSPLSSPTLSSSPSSGKPTVQVAPMPPVSSDPIEEEEKRTMAVRGQKPAIPRKPALFSSSSSSTTTTMMSASTESLHRLCASPSLLSLQAAFQDTQQLSPDQMAELESRRRQLMESMQRRVDILDEERQFVQDERDANDALGRSLLTTMGKLDEHLTQRLSTVTIRCKEAMALELRIKAQHSRLTRLIPISQDVDEVKRSEQQRRRLEEQMTEAGELCAQLHRRGQALWQRLIEGQNGKTSGLFSSTGGDWPSFISVELKLAQQLAELDEKLLLARRQLTALCRIGTDDGS